MVFSASAFTSTFSAAVPAAAFLALAPAAFSVPVLAAAFFALVPAVFLDAVFLAPAFAVSALSFFPASALLLFAFVPVFSASAPVPVSFLDTASALTASAAAAILSACCSSSFLRSSSIFCSNSARTFETAGFSRLSAAFSALAALVLPFSADFADVVSFTVFFVPVFAVVFFSSFM